MNSVELAWLAGLLEGEGYFALRRGRYPLIALTMTDFDVVERVAEMIGAGSISENKTKKGKPILTFVVYGNAAIETMRAILPLMGERRSNKIQEILNYWDNPFVKSRRERKRCRNGHKMIDDNIYITPNGKRVCRTCKRDNLIRYRARQ